MSVGVVHKCVCCSYISFMFICVCPCECVPMCVSYSSEDDNPTSAVTFTG